MNKILAFLGLLLCAQSFAQAPQPGVQQVYRINFNNVTDPEYSFQNLSNDSGYIYTPKDYSKTTKNYPIIISYHGDGGTGYNLPVALSNAVAHVISMGETPDSITAFDGNQYSFIAVSPVNNSGGEIGPTIDTLIKRGWRIDRSRVYVTGLSAGAAETVMAVTSNDAISKLIAAVVPFSTPSFSNPLNYSLIAKYHIHSWFWGGSSDPWTTTGGKVFSSNFNSAYPGSSLMTVYPCGHGCWDTYYNPKYVDPVQHMSIYQFMLQYRVYGTVPANNDTLHMAGPGGMQLQGFIHLPKDYYTSNTNYPVVLFANGTMLPADLQGMAGQPFVSQLTGGMSLDNIVNPADGKPYSFIALSIVNNNYPNIPAEMRWMKQYLRIDSNRVYATGLSQGGAGTVMDVAVVDSSAKYIAADVPMSPPGITTSFDYSLLTKYHIRSWFFAGNSDGFTAAGTNVYVANFNAAYPGSTIATIYAGGHGGWNTFYDRNYVDPTQKMSIYQWMLQFAKGQTTTILAVHFKSIKLIPAE